MSTETTQDETKIKFGPFTRRVATIGEPAVYLDVANGLRGIKKDRFEWLQDPKISPYQVERWIFEIMECDTGLQKLRDLITDFDEALAAYDAQRQEWS